MKWNNPQHVPTIVLSLFALALPWQTRWIAGWSYLSGSPTEFATLSLYATQALLFSGLFVAYAVAGFPKINEKYRLSVALGALIFTLTLISGFFAQWSVAALAGIVELAFASLFFFALLDKRVEVKSVMTCFALGLLIPVGLGLFQVFFDGNGPSALLGLAAREADRPGDAVSVLANGDRILRAYGSFPHPNIFGGYLAIGLLSAAATLRRDRWTMSLLVLLGFGLLLTLSRSAALGLLLGVGLATLVYKMRNTNAARVLVIPIAILVIGSALGASLFAPELVSSLRGGGVTEERSLSERREQYQEFPSVMEGDDWLLGNGPRNYVFALAEQHPERSVWDYQPIHNVPLLILAEIGFIGAMAVFAWSSSIDRINFARFPNRDALYAFAMGNVVLVILFFDHYIWSSWAGLALIAYVMALTLRLGEE